MKKIKISSVKDAEKVVDQQNGIISSLIRELKDNNKVNYKQFEGSSLPKFLQSKQFGKISDQPEEKSERIESEETIRNPSKESASKILGSIYKLMKKNREHSIKDRELEKTKRKNDQKDEDKMYKELVESLEELSQREPSKIPEKTKEKSESEQKQPKSRPSKKPSKSRKSDRKFGRKSRKSKGQLSLTGTIGATAVLATGKSALSEPLTGGVAKIAASTIAKEEGLPKNGKAYWDPPGQTQKVSVGYGHQIKDNEYKQGFIQAGDEQVPVKGNRGIDTVLTPDQAQKLLQNDLPKYVDAAQKPLGSSWQKLADPQKAALVSYSYNTGSTASLVKAGIKESIDRGDTKGAAEIIRDKGIKTAGGKFVPVLASRRNKEAMIFASADIKGNGATPVSDIPKSAGVTAVSDTNKNLKDDMVSQRGQQVAVVNTNIINSSTTQSSPTPRPSKEEDKPAYLRKSYA